MAVNFQNLCSEIYSDLLTELDACDDKSKSLLLAKVKNAIREVVRTREYPDSYSEEQIEGDLERYYSNIRGLALYDYNQIGAEGQTSHSENGESRTWAERMDCLKGIVAIASVV